MKRFYQLKRGELFQSDRQAGWDLMKKGFFTARTAHAFLENFTFLPWERVETIKPNPYCEKRCPCKFPYD
jgi:hypothetical protein